MKRLFAFLWDLKWYWMTPLFAVIALMILWVAFFGGDVNSIFNYMAF